MSSPHWTRATSTCVRVLAIVALALSDVAQADTPPHLVRDINQVRIPESSAPQYLGTLNGRVLFGAIDRGGAGLWSTDGTSGGTHLVSRVEVFAQQNFPGLPLFVVQNGLAFFVGDDGGTGVFELWVTDGTSAGTLRLTSHAPSATSYSGFRDFIGVLHERVIFYATDANGVMQVWSSDGTVAGTVQLSQLQGPYNAQSPSLVFADRFYFVSSAGPYQAQLWVSDGTPQGTRAVQSSNPPFYSIRSLTAVGNLPLFAANNLLWAIDPASETVFPVTAAGIPPGYPNQPPVGGLVQGGVASIGSTAISVGSNSFNVTELWRSDGSADGTYLLADIEPGQFPIDQRVANFIVTVQGHALMIAEPTAGSFELLSTDGTLSGTGPVLSLAPPTNSFAPLLTPIGVVDDLFFFALTDGTVQGGTIWRSDGTASGTWRTSLPDSSFAGATQLLPVGSRVFVALGSHDERAPLLVYDPATDSTTTVESALAVPYGVSWVAADGQAYFSVDDPTIGNEPWLSDGTAHGTHLIRDINPEWSDYPSNPGQFVQFNGQLAFVADDGVHGEELWISDGTSQGTHLLADVNPGPAGSNPTELTARGRDLFFFATDDSGVQNLMRLHAGKTQPEILARLKSPTTTQPPYNFSCYTNTMLLLGPWIYLSASDGSSGFELWRTDGTPGSVRRVADIAPGYPSSYPCTLTAVLGGLYFSAISGNGNGPELLWHSDGTAVGTKPVTLAPNAPSLFPADLTDWHGDLYFDLNDGSHGAQIWRSRGGAATASLFLDLAPGNLNAFGFPVNTLPHHLLFESAVPDASGQNYVVSLWASDGTPGKATVLTSSYIAYSLKLQSQVLFFTGGTQGLEAWLTDGTVTGTHHLTDIAPGAQTSMDWLINFGPGAAFTTHDAANAGVDALWRTDGTTSGTVRVGWIPNPTSDPFGGTQQLAVGSNLFFVGSTPGIGNELWVYSHCFGSRTSTPCSPSNRSGH